MTVRDAVRAFYAAGKTGEKVAKLLELGYALGFERSTIAADVVKQHGQGAAVVDSMLAAAQYADGDPWEYVQGVFSREKANSGGTNRGWQNTQQAQGARFDAPLTEAELETLGRQNSARAAAGGGGGPGDDAVEHPEPIQGQVGEPVQQSGDGGGGV